MKDNFNDTSSILMNELFFLGNSPHTAYTSGGRHVSARRIAR